MRKVLTGLLSLALAAGALAGFGISANAEERATVYVASNGVTGGITQGGTFTSDNWMASGLPDTRVDGFDSVQMTTGGFYSQTADSSATWTTSDGKLNGVYDVYFYKISRNSSSSNNTITVKCGNDVVCTLDSVGMFANEFKGEWIKLCQYDFGTNVASVTLTSGDGNATHAKDVKFVPVEIAPVHAFATNENGYSTSTAAIKMPEGVSNPNNYTNMNTFAFTNGVTTNPAVFRPSLPMAGTYDVYLWQTFYFPNGEWKTPLVNVKLTQGEKIYETNGVEYSNGATSNDALDWVKVGSYSFDNAGEVTVNVWGDLNNPNGTGVLRVSYIKFVRTGGVSEPEEEPTAEPAEETHEEGFAFNKTLEELASAAAINLTVTLNKADINGVDTKTVDIKNIINDKITHVTGAGEATLAVIITGLPEGYSVKSAVLD